MIRIVPRRTASSPSSPAASHTPPRARPASLTERLLQSLGAEHEFAEAVLGDLREEYALRASRDGVGAARRWYVREALRSAPHLLWSSLRHACRYHRSRVVAVIAGIAFTSVVVVIALLMRDGPPARLAAGTDDVVVVNNLKPVHVPVRVMDAAGHALNLAGVRFRRISGAAVRVATNGEVTCTKSGDARVRVSLGAISHDILLRCRPMSLITEAGDAWIYVVGDSAHAFPISGVGPDGKPVDLVAGTASVSDSDVISLDGLLLHPKAPGTTKLDVTVGDIWMETTVTVHERAATPVALRPGQAFVSALRLPSGGVRRWPLRPGYYRAAAPNDP